MSSSGGSGGTTAAPGIARIQDGLGSGLVAANVPNFDAGGLGTAMPALDVLSIAYLFNGATWDRVRSASAAVLSAFSGIGAALVAPPGQWSAVSAPAAGSQASASRSAGGAGVRHVATATTFSWGAIAAPVATLLQANVRDGATGAGTIIEAAQAAVPAAVFQGAPIPLAPNNPGTAATAMTAEFSAALANLAEGATLNGYDVS